MAKVCCVCSESKENPDNQLFCCQGHGCDVTVHQATKCWPEGDHDTEVPLHFSTGVLSCPACYGIVNIPNGLWFCRKCESQERAARVRCELCPRKEGALKRTDSGGWAHVVCALYIPEVTFGNNVRMEPIVTSKLPRERFSKSCYLCEEQGLETQAGHGACMACHKSGCRLAFHVTWLTMHETSHDIILCSAQKERLLCEEEDSRDSRNIVYCGYCMTHFKKMIRQKYKQTALLRKQMTTPTTSTAPPLPTTPTATAADTPTTPTPQHPSLPAPAQASTLLPARDPDEKREAHKPIKPKDKEKHKADLPHKRLSTDAPIPPAKRKRRRKVSSSNESTTSETLSHTSDIQHHLASNINIPVSPSSNTTRSPLTVVGQALISKATKELPESSSNEFLPSSKEVQPSSVIPLSVLPPHPLSPVSAALGLPTTTGGSQFAMDAIAGRQTGSTSSDHSSASRLQAPPLSLHELLKRQWEQTAQFILDQAGRQNNAGVMLAHLHQLQSENQRMQSRIMELASQREFYIATNTRLSQTLAEQDGSRLPNGVQPPGEGIQQALHLAVSSSPPASGNGTPRSLEESENQEGSDSRQPVVVVSSSMTKAAQDSLLQAHFMATSLPQHQASSFSSKSITMGTHKKESSRHRSRVGSHQDTSQQDSRSRSAQELLHTSAGGLSNTLGLENERLTQQSGGIHEITHVTNSIQAPITTYTPLPSDSPLDSESGWFFNRNVSSNPRNKS